VLSGGIDPFRAARCFRNEFRRVILAFAARTASVLAVCFGCGSSAAFPAARIVGNTCVGIIEARSSDCVLIGPVGCLLLGILDNSLLPGSFRRGETPLLQAG
jgi:hypothetical protein